MVSVGAVRSIGLGVLFILFYIYFNFYFLLFFLQSDQFHSEHGITSTHQDKSVLECFTSRPFSILVSYQTAPVPKQS